MWYAVCAKESGLSREIDANGKTTMDYYLLADMTVQIGYELAIAGAETYRVEETMRRVIAAYGTEGQAFAIPNCVAVSFVAQNTKPLTIMKRVGYHGNDLERIEKLNALSGAFAPRCRNWPRRSAGSRRQWRACAATLRHLLSRQLHCRSGLLLRLRRHGARLAVGGAERPDHRLCYALARPARGQPVFQHHCGVISHGAARHISRPGWAGSTAWPWSSSAR